MAGTRALDPDALEHDDRAEADRAGRGDPRRSASRRPRHAAQPSRAAATAKRITVSQAGPSHSSDRLKESGIIRDVVARLDPAAAGFALELYVAVTLERHADRAHRRFAEAVRSMPEVIHADWVTGETDALLHVLAREVAELQRVLVRLSTRGGAARVTTLLHLEELKRATALPLRLA